MKTKNDKSLGALWQKIWNNPLWFGLIGSFGMLLLIESLSRHRFWGGFLFLFHEPMYFLMNWLMIATFLSLTYLIPKRIFAQAVVALVFVGLGIINCILLYTRITPLEAVDFSILRTGISIVNIYLTVLQLILCGAAILGVIAGMVILFIKSPKSPVHFVRAAVVFVGFAVAGAAMIISLTVFGSIPTDLNEAYDTYGFTYCFSRSIFDRGIPEPEDYSAYTIEEILSSISSEENQEPESKPNIIMIQLESFMDINLFSDFTFAANPVPNFTELKKTCSSGRLYVPSVGAGTANTEFEVLTGMNLDEFGTGEYPYKTILQEKSCESICYNLRELGYTAHGFHNNTGTFYSRHTAYQNLGFDTFTPLEYMSGYAVNPLGWAKDECLADQIIDAMESTKGQDFVFAVSVQGHGKYPTEPVEGEKLILVDGIENQALRHQFAYYAYQLWEMDRFIGELIDALSALDEDCVLVLYGDHQPSLEYSVEDLSVDSKYISEYVIWTNYSSERNVRDIESYQLSALVLDMLKMENGLLTKLHQNYSTSIDYLDALRMLQYDMLYGDMLAYGGIEYTPTDMHMGYREIQIQNIVYIEGRHYIVGENFTKSSVVYVNERSKNTTFISDTVLLLNDQKLEVGDQITVRQITGDFIELGASKSYNYEDVSIAARRYEKYS
ncbi:MAG: sulfatase-like hydrolase/transferase [Clostridiales bacterium]|jgi:phosphoglycerol transferase MdoB-like AlkP superfamily enzyme|nr:sulfatase-like hydrolase/transferase [Clostridiales bacterium]